MLLNDHYYFFQGGIACSFTQPIDGTFYLPCPIDNSGNRVCRCQSKVIMAMTGNNCLVNIGDIIYQKSYFFTILMRKTVSGGIRNIYDCGPCFNNSFHHFCEVYIVGSSCIFGIKLHIVYKVFSPFDALNGPL